MDQGAGGPLEGGLTGAQRGLESIETELFGAAAEKDLFPGCDCSVLAQALLRYLNGKEYFRHLKKLLSVPKDSEEDLNMAATVTPDLIAAEVAMPVAVLHPAALKRRIGPEAGRALEKLGHAIEYLTDEYVHSGGSLAARDPRLEAVQLLISINRKIYFSCPAVQGPLERIRAWLRVRGA